MPFDVRCHRYILLGEPYVLSTRSNRNDSIFFRENQFHKFPRNAVFLPNHQESYSPGEPVSAYLGFLEGMEFPLDLTEQVPPRQSAQRGGLSDGANSCSDCSWLPGGGRLSLSLLLEYLF